MAATQTPRRLDIQGLRAVASLLVASHHIWFGTVSGGVDVLFAVGGYLLALSLIGEIERTGAVDVPRTLWRIAQRLFPMAALVLVVAGAVALVASGPLAFGRVLSDVFASATYWENWRLAADGTDYVAAGHDKSPFQHFWAMGVQGQFTALAVLAAAGFALVGGRRMRDARLGFGLLLAAVAAASFGYALLRLSIDPVGAYYDTFARSWELALGGAAALLLTRIPLPGRLRAALAAVGIALVLTAGRLPVEWLQPGWVTLWPVAGALLVLVAGAGAGAGAQAAPGPVTRVLQARPLVWLGGLSYGLYLWHWPALLGLIALVAPEGGGVGPLGGMLVLVVSVLLAWGSERAIARLHAPRGARRRLPVLALAMPVVAAVTAVALAAAPAVQRDAIERAAPTAPAERGGAALAARVAAAAASPSVPDAEAVVGADGRVAEWLVDDCLTVDLAAPERCRFDDAPGDDEVWIVGDSQAVTWATAVRGALDGRADVQLLGRSMCPFSTGPVVEAQVRGLLDQCDAHAQGVLALAAERRPAAVVISYGAWWVGEGYERRVADTGEQLAAGTLAYAEQLHALGIPTLYLDGPPPVPEPAACLEAHADGGALDACASPLQPEQRQRHEALEAALAAGGVSVAGTLEWFCAVEAATCPLVVDGVPTWTDATHMGAAASSLRQDAVAEALLPLLGR
ncbi:MAG: acyltransferase family protein [Actinomycetes bacterium]